MTENDVGMLGRHYSIHLNVVLSCINIYFNIKKYSNTQV